MQRKTYAQQTEEIFMKFIILITALFFSLLSNAGMIYDYSSFNPKHKDGPQKLFAALEPVFRSVGRECKGHHYSGEVRCYISSSYCANRNQCSVRINGPTNLTQDQSNLLWDAMTAIGMRALSNRSTAAIWLYKNTNKFKNESYIIGFERI